MTLQLKPQSIVKVDNQYRKLGNLFSSDKNIEDLFEKNWSVEMFWFPFNSYSCDEVYDPKNDEVWLRVINKVQVGENVKLKQEDYYNLKEKEDKISQEALLMATPILTDCPIFTPHITWLSLDILKKMINPTGPIYQQLPHAVHFRYAYLL